MVPIIEDLLYKVVWEAAIGEMMICEQEPISDSYAVAVMKWLLLDIAYMTF